MNKLFLSAVAALILASLFQASVVPLPLGTIVVLLWFWFRRVKHLLLLIAVYSLILASVADLPTYSISLATSCALLCFVVGKKYLPSRIGPTLGLITFSLVAWEASLLVILKVANI